MRTIYGLVFGGVGIWLALFTGAASAGSSSPKTGIATFSAWEHRFDGPKQLSAGQTTVRFPGREGTFTAELTPGRYAIMCLFSTTHPDKSHAAKGMVLNFTIE